MPKAPKKSAVSLKNSRSSKTKTSSRTKTSNTPAKIHDQRIKRGEGGELHQTARGATPVLTTAQGGPVQDDHNSLKTGTRGSVSRWSGCSPSLVPVLNQVTAHRVPSIEERTGLYPLLETANVCE